MMSYNQNREMSLKSVMKNATRRFSRKGSYDIGGNAPSFKVKTLCLEGLEVGDLEASTSVEAVDMALASAGSLEGRNKHDVVMKVSVQKGIQIISRKTKKELYSYKIHEVGYCNVDKRYQEIFVFIAARSNSPLKCHVFLCDDLQKSRAICLTMAKAFQVSFDNWKKTKEMDNPELNSANLIDRRRSAGVVKVPTKNQLEKRRASDFVTAGGLQRLQIRRSSEDAVYREYSDEESMDGEATQAFEDFMSRSVEEGACSLLRRGSTDWDAIAKDEEVQRKMQGDLILWE